MNKVIIKSTRTNQISIAYINGLIIEGSEIELLNHTWTVLNVESV